MNHRYLPRSLCRSASLVIGVVGTLLAGLSGCSSSAASSDINEAVGTAPSPVIKGTASTSDQDSVVLLVRYDGREFGACTGTLIAPQVVLTARHCVADTDESAACKLDGSPIAAGSIRRNYPADTFFVFTGSTRPNFRAGNVSPAGVGAQVLDDGAKNLCNHDIALIVLEKPIADAVISPIRLEADVVKGELITAVGWGVTDKARSPQTRQQRAGVKVRGIGPDGSGVLPVPPNEFNVGESICSGDSGGPAFAESGAVVGVVSRGGNGAAADPKDPAAGCVNSFNIFTKVAPFKEFITNALASVDAEPWEENGPDPRTSKKAGAACTEATQCAAGHCIDGTCADDCSATACPEGRTCETVEGAQVCRDPNAAKNGVTTTTTTTGCASSPSTPSSSGVFGAALVGLGLMTMRRRRR